jgi:hypothetical protein
LGAWASRSVPPPAKRAFPERTSSFRFAAGDDVVPGGDDGFESCREDCKAGTGPTLESPYAIATDCRGVVYTVNSGADDPTPPALALSAGGKAKPAPCKLSAGKLKRKRLSVFVPYAGRLTLTGKGLRTTRTTHRGLAGRERLRVKPKPKARGKGVRVKVVVQPTDGNAKQTVRKRIRL